MGRLVCGRGQPPKLRASIFLEHPDHLRLALGRVLEVAQLPRHRSEQGLHELQLEETSGHGVDLELKETSQRRLRQGRIAHQTPARSLDPKMGIEVKAGSEGNPTASEVTAQLFGAPESRAAGAASEQ